MKSLQDMTTGELTTLINDVSRQIREQGHRLLVSANLTDAQHDALFASRREMVKFRNAIDNELANRGA